MTDILIFLGLSACLLFLIAQEWAGELGRYKGSHPNTPCPPPQDDIERPGRVWR